MGRGVKRMQSEHSREETAKAEEAAESAPPASVYRSTFAPRKASGVRTLESVLSDTESQRPPLDDPQTSRRNTLQTLRRSTISSQIVEESGLASSDGRASNSDGRASNLAGAREAAADSEVLSPRKIAQEKVAQELVRSVHTLVAGNALIGTDVTVCLENTRSVHQRSVHQHSVHQRSVQTTPLLAIKLGAQGECSETWWCKLHGAPDVCVELVDPNDTLNRDINLCLQRHLALGTQELVRFDPTGCESQSVRIWRREGEGFRSFRFSREEPVRSPLLGLFWVWRERPTESPAAMARLVLSKTWTEPALASSQAQESNITVRC